jgi:hypothetical protein
MRLKENQVRIYGKLESVEHRAPDLDLQHTLISVDGGPPITLAEFFVINEERITPAEALRVVEALVRAHACSFAFRFGLVELSVVPAGPAMAIDGDRPD